MILTQTPLTLAQAKALASVNEKNPLFLYLKKFTRLSKERAEQMLTELRALNNAKLKEETLVKIADVLPQDAEDVHKIAIDQRLAEEEVQAILSIVKNY